MPRKLKTYLTSQGFYDLAIAAPSMKAALEPGEQGATCFTRDLQKRQMTTTSSHVGALASAATALPPTSGTPFGPSAVVSS